MNIHALPLNAPGVCSECWCAYDIHSDTCSKSTALTCTVCGGKYHQAAAPGICLKRDDAHTEAVTTSRQRAA